MWYYGQVPSRKTYTEDKDPRCVPATVKSVLDVSADLLTVVIGVVVFCNNGWVARDYKLLQWD